MKKIIPILFVIILAITLLYGCGKTSTVTQTTTTQVQTTVTATSSATSTQVTTSSTSTTDALSPKSGGVLKIIIAENPTNSMGIPANLRGQSPFYVKPCLEPLMKYNDSGDLVGILATDWKLSADLTYLDINLRQGVKFHDGTAFDAEAAKWNLDYNMNVPVAGTETWESIEVTGPYSIRLHLNKYENTFMQDLTGVATTMISPTAFKANGVEWADWNPVGTGAFKWNGYETDKYIAFDRFDDYWGGKPYLEGVRFVIIPDLVSAELAMEAGDGDVIYMIGRWNDIARDLVPKGFVTDGITFGIRGIVPDSGHPSSILSNLQVRQALEYAINRPEMVGALGFGFYTPLEQAATPFNNGWIPDYQGRSYNIETAKELLGKAGYPKGFDTTIYAGVHLTGHEIEAIQAYWQQIDVVVDIQMVTPAKWLDLEANGWNDAYYSAGLTSMGTEAIYGTWIKRYWAPDSGRFPNIERSPEFLAAINAAFAEPDPGKQKTLYQNVNRMLMDNAIVLPLWYDLAPWTFSPKVHGLDITKWTDPAGQSWAKAWME